MFSEMYATDLGTANSFNPQGWEVIFANLVSWETCFITTMMTGTSEDPCTYQLHIHAFRKKKQQRESRNHPVFPLSQQQPCRLESEPSSQPSLPESQWQSCDRKRTKKSTCPSCEPASAWTGRQESCTPFLGQPSDSQEHRLG